MSQSAARIDSLVQTTFWSDPETALPPGEPSAPMRRLFWLALTLFRFGKANLSNYHETFRATEKTLQRDLRKLRKLGERYGFRVSRLQRGEVRFLDTKGKQRPGSISNADLGAVLQAIAAALGDPVASDLLAVESNAAEDGFLRIAIPRPIDDTSVGKAYRALRKCATDRARVAFRYRRRDRTEKQRTVDPHAAIFHSGRYYLVGYDVRARDWRLFALDGIIGEIKRVGTFTRRAIPSLYTEMEAVGLIKSGPSIDVTIELSAAIASAVTARSWHRDQRVSRRSDGSALMVLPVCDAGEIVRWVMGFGAEARIVDPCEVVWLAKQLSELMLQNYSDDARQNSGRVTA